MELIGKISLIIHIIAGVNTLIAGPIALFYQKKSRPHRIAGKVFTYSMIVVIITAIFTFVRFPSVVFYQFLFAISILVSLNIWQGVRSIQFMKGTRPGQFDRSFIWVFIMTGVAMINAAVWYFMKGQEMAFPILFGVFGTLILKDGLRFRRFILAENVSSRWWLRNHIDAMMGAFIASTTAFFINATELPWYIEWFGPTLVLQPMIIYFLNERKLMKKHLGNPFEQPVTA